MSYSNSGWAQQAGASQLGDYFYGGDFTTGHGEKYGISEILKEAYIEPHVYRIGMDINFFQFFGSKNSITVNQTMYTHLDEEPRPHTAKLASWSTASSATATNSTVLGFAGGLEGAFEPNWLWMNERTKEVVLVKSVAATLASAGSGMAAGELPVTVIRAYGTQGAAAVQADDVFRRLGNTLSESQLPGDNFHIRTGHSNNTVQKFSHVIGVTNMLREQGVRGGEVLKRQRQNVLYEHFLAKESQFIYGQFVEDTNGLSSLKDSAVTDWKGQTRGILGYLDMTYPTGHPKSGENRSNILDAGGNLTFDDLSEFLHQINLNRRVDNGTTIQTSGGSQEQTMGKYNLVAVCGFEAKQALGWLQRKNHVHVSPMEKSFGFDLMTIQTEGGKLDIYQHNLLTEGFAGHMLIVDRSRIRTVKYQNHTDKGNAGLKVRDITIPNMPGYQEELYEVCGFELMNPECHGYIYNP